MASTEVGRRAILPRYDNEPTSFDEGSQRHSSDLWGRSVRLNRHEDSSSGETSNEWPRSAMPCGDGYSTDKWDSDEQ